MAIFRGGVKIFGSDVRVGITRDRSLDNIMYDKRFQQIEGGLVPNNSDLRSTKPALINQMLQYIAQAEGLARSNRFYTSFRLPGDNFLGSDDEFENFENADPDSIDERGIELGGFSTTGETQIYQNMYGRRVNAFCKSITIQIEQW